MVYVGQTTQELRKRIQRHLSDISLAKRDEASRTKTLTSAASHFLRHHEGKSTGIKTLQHFSIFLFLHMTSHVSPMDL